MKKLTLSVMSILISLPITSNANSHQPAFNSNDQAKALKLDVSDISYLWPNHDSLREPDLEDLKYLKVIDKDHPENDLVPSRKDLQTIINFSYGEYGTFRGIPGISLTNPFTGNPEFAASETDSFLDINIENDLYISSFRVDDCGHGLHGGNNTTTIDKWVLENDNYSLKKNQVEPCVTMIRLVANPITINGSGDTAIHLIYTYKNSDVLESLMSDLQVLKSFSPVKTDGLGLGVHPGFLHEDRKKFSEKVIEFIEHYANKNFLTNLAFLSTNEFDGGDTWNFFEAEIHHDGNSGESTFNMRTLPFLKNNAISQGFGGKMTLEEAKLIDDRLPKIGLRTNAGQDVKSKPEHIRIAMNPEKGFTSSMDCRTCHSETKELINLASNNDFDELRKIFNNASTVFYREKITGFPRAEYLSKNPFDFRALGWFRGQETVTFRAASKTAGVAASINKRLFGSQVGNGLDCKEKRHKLVQCLVANAGNESNNCFQINCN